MLELGVLGFIWFSGSQPLPRTIQIVPVSLANGAKIQKSGSETGLRSSAEAAAAPPVGTCGGGEWQELLPRVLCLLEEQLQGPSVWLHLGSTLCPGRVQLIEGLLCIPCSMGPQHVPVHSQCSHCRDASWCCTALSGCSGTGRDGICPLPQSWDMGEWVVPGKYH